MTGVAVAAAPRVASADAPALAAQARAMSSRLLAPAEDGIATWSGSGAALSQAWHATTPEDLARGPAVASSGPWRLVADARIDNRGELTRALGVPDAAGDPDLLLAAWEKWRDDVLLHVLGDYVFAVWNDDSRRLVLGRDPLGMRPLYFAVRGDVVLAASELHALGTGPFAVDFTLDADEAASFMVDRHTATRATLFREIETVGPGEVVRFDPGSPPRRRRMWQPDPFARAPEGDFEFHRERVRDVLAEAITARMRTVETPSFLLSGGVDSTVVTCLAHRLAPPSAPRAHLHLSQRGMPGDETAHFERVVAAVGGEAIVEHALTHLERIGPDSDLVAPGELYDVTATMMAPLFAHLPQRGRNVVMSGVGSDDILQESGNECFTHLAAGRLGAAWASARRVGPETGGTVRYFLRQVLRAALPAEAWHLTREWRPSSWAWPDWLTPEARRRLDARHRRQVRAMLAVPAPDAIQRGIALTFRGEHDLHLLLARNDFQARCVGIEERTPYYDRRVVEALLALPHALRFDGVRPKPILRAVGRGVAPAENLARTGPAHFSAFIERARVGVHHAAWTARLRDSELERVGVVRPGALLALLDGRPGARALSRAMAIEVAVRTLRASVQPTGEELRERARACHGGARQGACIGDVEEARWAR